MKFNYYLGVYTFDQSDSNLFAQKILGTASYYFSRKNVPEKQATSI